MIRINDDLLNEIGDDYLKLAKKSKKVTFLEYLSVRLNELNGYYHENNVERIRVFE